MIIVRNCGIFVGNVASCCARHGSAASGDRSLKVMERDAERRTTSGGLDKVDTVSTKSDAPRDRYPPASRQVALFRPYRDPGRSASGNARRSKRTSHYRLRHIPLPSTTPTAGGPGQQPGPRTVRVSPSNLSPLDRPPPPRWSLAMRPFLATRWLDCTAGFEAGDGGARTLVEHPSPLAGEGGRRRRSDEGSRKPNRLRRNANPTGQATPHLALRATFSRKGRRMSARPRRCIRPPLAPMLELGLRPLRVSPCPKPRPGSPSRSSAWAWP
jgi:hypothetical protein